jgi:hypothetical protein
MRMMKMKKVDHLVLEGLVFLRKSRLKKETEDQEIRKQEILESVLPS